MPPTNGLDAIFRQHDMAYGNAQSAYDVLVADRTMLTAIEAYRNTTEYANLPAADKAYSYVAASVFVTSNIPNEIIAIPTEPTGGYLQHLIEGIKNWVTFGGPHRIQDAGTSIDETFTLTDGTTVQIAVGAGAVSAVAIGLAGLPAGIAGNQTQVLVVDRNGTSEVNRVTAVGLTEIQIERVYDPSNTHSWSSITTERTAQNIVTNVQTVNDNGSRTDAAYGADGVLDILTARGADGLVDRITTYDLAGRVDTDAIHDAQGLRQTVFYFDDANRVDIRYDYDTEGRVDVERHYDDSSTLDLQIFYDDAGVIRNRYDYDDAGRIDSYRIYDAAGRLDDMFLYNDASQMTARYLYDDGNRIDSYTTFDAAGRVDEVFTYDDAGRLDTRSSYDDANLIDVYRTYDDGGHIEEQFIYDDANIMRSRYTYDDGDHLRIERLYDTAGRMDSQRWFDTSNSLDFRFEYDDAGRIDIKYQYTVTGALESALYYNDNQSAYQEQVWFSNGGWEYHVLDGNGYVDHIYGYSSVGSLIRDLDTPSSTVYFGTDDPDPYGINDIDWFLYI